MKKQLRDSQAQLDEKEEQLSNQRIQLLDIEKQLKDSQGQLQKKEELEENSKRQLLEMDRHSVERRTREVTRERKIIS